MLENYDEAVKNQYELLNILDGKASALLTFNALALASISIWVGYVPLNYLHLILDVVFVVLLVSCGFLLYIIWLRWAKLHDRVYALDKVRVDRTRCYRFAWKLSAASVTCLIAVSIVHGVGTALIATNSCG